MDNAQTIAMTKAEARRILGINTDYQLAKRLKRNRASVSRWGRMVPDYLVTWILEGAQGEPPAPPWTVNQTAAQ